MDPITLGMLAATAIASIAGGISGAVDQATTRDTQSAEAQKNRLMQQRLTDQNIGEQRRQSMLAMQQAGNKDLSQAYGDAAQTENLKAQNANAVGGDMMGTLRRGFMGGN